MKKITVGILAHVDAGKTTLSEGLLFAAGSIGKLGRVDKRSSFFDTYSLERERGITIFSKQAVLTFGDTEMSLLDTPGHVDFSCETERALSVQDYAILVISAPDGIQSHTKTLWHLLASRNIPTFIFINKTDICERTRAEIMAELRSMLSPACSDFSSGERKYEDAAACDEALMSEFFDTGRLSDVAIRRAVSRRALIPCYFGSALKMNGVKDFLTDIDRYTEEIRYNERIFGAKVYKIARDASGKRLTYMKITGGRLVAKDSVKTVAEDGSVYVEKAEEIRIYSGDKYKSVKEAHGGTVCAVLGPQHTEAGMGLGVESNEAPTLTPVLDYKMILPDSASVYETYLKLSALAEEEPSLALSYNERAKEIRVRLMGDIQTEVLKRLISERFGIDVSFAEGSILYKETVAAEVRGAGHFEPLRHYAEVHLLIEPLPRGSGVICTSDCSTDLLALNWQRLVITHLEEKLHKGVLTGSPLTDVKITLTAGKAHIKHTEGGDFRQATYRAVRQALMKAESVLLEPTFDFRIELPTENLGRAMNDVAAMYGKAEPPEICGSRAALTGTAPVSAMRSYASELRAYTKGEGKITLKVSGYAPCHNADEVIAEIGYDPELDERNTANSVFCKAGSGYVVSWREADAAMHISFDSGNGDTLLENKALRAKTSVYRGTAEEDAELMRIFERTYGKIKPRRVSEQTENAASDATAEKPKKQKPRGDDYVIIDGYNFIFADPSLSAVAKSDFALARDTLIRIMCEYSVFRHCKVITVFDAYKRKDGAGSAERCGNVEVIYTKEGVTADAYIEKATHDLADKHRVRVVTSDMQEQLMILGSGGLRVSAGEFSKELAVTAKEIKEIADALGQM